MAKILYVVSRPLEINTSSSIRNKATILGLLENGNDVDLVTTEPDTKHPAFDSSNVITKIQPTTLYIHLNGSQSIIRFLRRTPFFGILKRLKASFVSSNSIYDNLKGICDYTNRINLEKGNYDYIISSSDPKSSHLFVKKLIKEQGCFFHGQWIQIWGDPFLHDMTQKSTVNHEEIRKEEKALLSAADKVIYVSPLTLDEQKKTYPESSSKMFFLPIPYLIKNEVCPPTHENNKLRLSYCGDYNSTVRNLNALYLAVTELEGVFLEIYGSSDKPLSSNNHVIVHGRSGYQTVSEAEKSADVLVHVCNLFGNQIPGKIYQYSGTCKPILFILDGNKKEIFHVFEKYKRYYFCDNDKDCIIEAICKIRAEKGFVNFEPVLDFNPSIIAKRLISD